MTKEDRVQVALGLKHQCRECSCVVHLGYGWDKVNHEPSIAACAIGRHICYNCCMVKQMECMDCGHKYKKI